MSDPTDTGESALSVTPAEPVRTEQSPPQLEHAPSPASADEAGADFGTFVRVFTGFLAGISLIVASLPLFLTNPNVLPALHKDFQRIGNVMVSIVCFLCIALIFHYRREIMLKVFAEAADGGSRMRLYRSAAWLPLAGLLVSVFSILVYYWSYVNNQTDVTWPLVPYTLIFAAPVVTICFAVLREYYNQIAGVSDRHTIAALSKR
ncbi:hypothetical protein V3328_21930 [Microbaculum marinum]|uniref:Uncharacterized protein n=1 Tax=Microbaculum marinum TaxID=1764581 RepID=A0AAW9S1W4_9HYPH